MKMEFVSITEVTPACSETPAQEVILQHVPGFDAVSAPWSAFELKSDTSASVPYYISTSEFSVNVVKLSRIARPVVQPQSVQLKFTVKIYTDDGTVQNAASQNVNVMKDTVYIGYEFGSAWPFTKDDSKLKVKVKLSGRGGLHHVTGLLLDAMEDTEIPYVLCGPGVLLPSSEFVLDGSDAPTSLDSLIVRNQLNVYFPHYTSALRHDFLLDMSSPIATAPDTTDPKVSIESDPFTLSKKWIYIGCIVLFLLLCMGIVFWNRKRIMGILRPGAAQQTLPTGGRVSNLLGESQQQASDMSATQQTQLPYSTEGSIAGNGEFSMRNRPIF